MNYHYSPNPRDRKHLIAGFSALALVLVQGGVKFKEWVVEVVFPRHQEPVEKAGGGRAAAGGRGLHGAQQVPVIECQRTFAKISVPLLLGRKNLSRHRKDHKGGFKDLC